MIFVIGCFICACGKEDNNASESLVEDTKESTYIEKTKVVEKEAAEETDADTAEETEATEETK